MRSLWTTSPRIRATAISPDSPLPPATLPAILWCLICLGIAYWINPFDSGTNIRHFILQAMIAAGGIVPLASSLRQRATVV
jgi:hypothetical protein